MVHVVAGQFTACPGANTARSYFWRGALKGYGLPRRPRGAMRRMEVEEELSGGGSGAEDGGDEERQSAQEEHDAEEEDSPRTQLIKANISKASWCR